MYSSSHAIEYSVSECPQIRPKWRHNNIETAPNCPRCASSNTKFCYYNNYSLSQPRYFCKGCRRYWTKGGSLRNVPVGGGCRKSRRARATRQAAGAASYAATTLAAAGCMGSAAEPERGAEIDLAAVFAKYVNPNIVEREESCSPGGSSGSSDNVQTNSLEIDGQVDDIALFFDQYQKPTDLRNGADDQLQEVIPQFSAHEGINGQDFVYQESNGFGLQQGLIGEEPGAEILWSEGTNLPNFECQQQSMVPLQDFGIFPPDDQLRISANLLSNDWGSFDLSGNGFF